MAKKQEYTDNSKDKSEFSKQRSLKTMIYFPFFILLSFSTSNNKQSFVH